MILPSEALSTATTICHTTFFAGRKVELKYIETRKRDVRARHSIHINFHVKTCTPTPHHPTKTSQDGRIKIIQDFL